MTANTMELKLAGLHVVPSDDFQARLAESRRQQSCLSLEACSAGALAPMPRRMLPVFQDANGLHYLLAPSAQGVQAFPFESASSSPAAANPVAGEISTASVAGTMEGALGAGPAGFISLAGLADPPKPDAFKQALAGIAMQFPQQLAQGMMTSMLQNLMLTGTAGNPLTAAMSQLGLGGGIGALLQGPLAGLANALPGGVAGPLASVVGQIQNSGAASGIIDGCFGSGSATNPFDNIDLEALSTQALSGVADQLMSLWQVDDDSPTAEQIAHHLAEKYQDKLKDAISDPDGAAEKLDQLMNGAKSSATLPAAHIGSKDDKSDVVVSGQGNVLAAGTPISRITDTLSPSGKIILEGVPMVQAGNLPVSRVTAATAVPSKIAAGAANVLIGGESVSIPAPPEPKKERPESDSQGADNGKSKSSSKESANDKAGSRESKKSASEDTSKIDDQKSESSDTKSVQGSVEENSVVKDEGPSAAKGDEDGISDSDLLGAEAAGGEKTGDVLDKQGQDKSNKLKGELESDYKNKQSSADAAMKNKADLQSQTDALRDEANAKSANGGDSAKEIGERQKLHADAENMAFKKELAVADAELKQTAADRAKTKFDDFKVDPKEGPTTRYSKYLGTVFTVKDAVETGIGMGNDIVNGCNVDASGKLGKFTGGFFGGDFGATAGGAVGLKACLPLIETGPGYALCVGGVALGGALLGGYLGGEIGEAGGIAGAPVPNANGAVNCKR